MPNLVAVDVSVTDNRIRLVFSDRAVAAAYAAYLRAQDMRPPQYQAIPGYQRAPRLHTTTKEVSLSLPDFITWFITCRLPDDEDAVTFTFMDEHEAHAARWADAMLLFEQVPGSHRHHHNQHPHHQHHDDGPNGTSGSGNGGSKQLHVRRLWNRAHLLKRLEELRRQSSASPTVRSRVGSPVWGSASGQGVVNGGRMQVALAVPAGMQRGDIWW